MTLVRKLGITGLCFAVVVVVVVVFDALDGGNSVQ
jgi:hypothetical protein